MLENDARVVRGLSIATIILSIIGVLFWLGVTLFAVVCCVAALAPETASWVSGSVGSAYAAEGILVAGGLAVFLVCVFLLLGAALAAVSLVAGILGFKSGIDPQKCSMAFGWSIAGAITAFFGGNVIVTVLLAIQAGYLCRVRDAARQGAGEPPAMPQPPYTSQPPMQ